MTISLCPVLMNFSMQITHSNQKWSPVLFVFRQLRHQEYQKMSVFLVIKCTSTAAFFFFQCPRFSACVCGLVDGRAQLSRANNWRNTLRYLEFKMTSTHHCVLYRNVRNRASFSMYVRKWASLLWEQTANPELSVMILSFFSSVELHMNSQGTSFSELNICTCFTSLYFRTLLPPRRLPRSCFLFLWGLKGQRALAEGEKRERRGDHEPEIYDCVDLPLWGWSLWIHLDFVLWRCCPACAIGYRALCKDTERHAF